VNGDFIGLEGLRTWRSRCWPAGSRCATSKMPSRTRTAGCCYRRPRCRSLGNGCGRVTRRSPSAPLLGCPLRENADVPGIFSKRATTFEDGELSNQLNLFDYYLFVDGIAERLRPGAKREPVLAARGFTIEGHRVLLHMMAGSKEDAETVTAFFEDMKRRGLNDPLLVTSDGAPGIVKAIEICFPRAARQRCLTHRMRNQAAKVPEDVWPDFKVRAQAAYQALSRAIARELAAGVVADFGRKYDNAVACFMDDFEACIAHLRFSVTHRRAIRTTNLLEHLFVEERRLKIILNAFGERAVLKLMFGALTRAAERWRSIKVTEFERRQLAAVRKELD
jgi:transposase-like protein